VALTWQDARFEHLATTTLYAILALRSRVFVAEQTCAYVDVDGRDLAAHHLWAEDGGEVVAYLRLLPPGTRYAELAIGRVVVDARHRAGGLGRELVRRGLRIAGAAPVRIGAQVYLERFYRELGFQRVSDAYDEDGIPHVEMLRVVHEDPCA
jgi:ElaA protein